MLKTMTIKFTAPLEPVPFPRPATNGKRRFNPTRYTEFKHALGLHARHAMQGRAPFAGAIKLTAEFFKLKPKSPTSRNWGDVDNHLKSVLDALQSICYHDDAQVVDARAVELFGKPHIDIQLEELP